MTTAGRGQQVAGPGRGGVDERGGANGRLEDAETICAREKTSEMSTISNCRSAPRVTRLSGLGWVSVPIVLKLFDRDEKQKFWSRFRTRDDLRFGSVEPGWWRKLKRGRKRGVENVARPNYRLVCFLIDGLESSRIKRGTNSEPVSMSRLLAIHISYWYGSTKKKARLWEPVSI